MNFKTIKQFVSENLSNVIFFTTWFLAVAVGHWLCYNHQYHDAQYFADLRCDQDDTIQENTIYRCENGGLLVRTDVGFACQCTRDYDGENCTETKRSKLALWMNRVTGRLLFTNSDEMLEGPVESTGWSIWPFVSDLPKLKNTYTFYQNKMKRLSTLMIDTTTVDKYRGDSFGRILPPVCPFHCVASQNYPLISVLHERIFERDQNTFLPDERRRNLFFHTFYQYFVLQFFNVDFNSSVSASQLYGADENTQRKLRSLSDGKLKTQFLNDEQYPPFRSSVKGVKMVYPGEKLSSNTEWFNRINLKTYPKYKLKWAMGHPLLSMNPMLFTMSTLWVREHNRVCDVLVKEYPSWKDDQIYHVAKRIVIGQMMRIMMNEIITAHTGSSFPLNLKPKAYHDQLQNISSFKTPLEVLLITMWPSSLPEQFQNTKINSMLFNSNSQVYENGLTDTIKCMMDQKMGMVTHNNDGTATERITSLMLKLSREYSVQHFNSYRRQLGLHAYGSFSELTGKQEISDKLQTLYDNVEDVELLPGILAEEKKNGNSPTATIMANSFIVNSILTNSLTSKQLWTASTFGGDIGFDVVQSASIESLVCNNLAKNCDGMSVKLYAD